MWYRLAVMLGKATIPEVQRSMTAAQFAEWWAYYNLEPFGGERVDLGFAQLCALVANAMRGRGRAPYKIEDFLMFTGKSSRKLTDPDEMRAYLEERF